jgi:predicted ATPase
VSIRNFKSIERLDLELAPLTILVGANGSGKTSILEAVALMGQAASSNRGLFESLRGELTDFEDTQSILSCGIRLKLMRLGFEGDVDIEKLRNSIATDVNELGKNVLSKEPLSEIAEQSRKRLTKIYSRLSSHLKKDRPRIRVKYSLGIKGDETLYSQVFVPFFFDSRLK